MTIRQEPATRQEVINWCRENKITFCEADGAKEPPYGWNWYYGDAIYLERRVAGYEVLTIGPMDIRFNLVPEGSLPVTDGKGNLVGTAHVGQEYKIDDPTKAEVIQWCRAKKVRFTLSDVLHTPPPGWRWTQRANEERRILASHKSGLSTSSDFVVEYDDVWPEGGKLDAGAVARERLMVRAKRKAKRILAWTIFMLVIALAAALGGVGWWAYHNVHTGYTIVEKQCGIQVGEVSLKGVRQYGYRYYEVLGARMNFNRDVTETTIVMLDGSPMMIVGTNSTDWWGIPVDAGDRGRQVLKPASGYTFVIGKKANVIDYEGFCKAQPESNDGTEQVAKADVKPTAKK